MIRTAKRLYLYLVCGIGMLLVVGGATTMLRLLLQELNPDGMPVSYVYGNYDPTREALSGAIAMLVVGLPLWLIHWTLIGRSIERDDDGPASERRSIVRSVYFSLVLIYLLAAGGIGAVTFLGEASGRLLGATNPFSFVSLSDSASSAIVLLAAWLLHARWRVQDAENGRRLEGVAAWVGRFYLYGAALIAILATVGAVSGLLTTGVDALANHNETMFPTGSPGFGVSGTVPTAAWWVRPILSMLAQLVVWAVLWALHWRFSVGLTGGDEPQALDERASRVRLTYFVAVVAIGAGYVVWGFSQGFAAALGGVVGTGSWTGPGPLWRDIAAPAASAVPLALAWWWHRRRALCEAQSSAATASPARAIGYVTALIGLGAFGYGMAWSAGLILRHLGQGNPDLANSTVDFWRWQTLQTIALAVVALPVWLWPWLARRRRFEFDRAREARSAARRSYLFVAVGATLLGAVVAAAVIVNRITRVIVGLQDDSFGSEIGQAIGVLLVLGPLLAYHLISLRADLSIDTGSLPRAEVAPLPAGRELVIVAPDGADLDALRRSLAAGLPPGYSVELRPSPDAG